MIVLDASAAIDLLLDEPAAVWVAGLAGDGVSGPHVIDLEVASALRRIAARGERAAEVALQTFGEWTFERYAAPDFLPRIWELRHTLTAYDAAYVALAEALDVPLVTTDRKLARSHGHSARIETPS